LIAAGYEAATIALLADIRADKMVIILLTVAGAASKTSRLTAPIVKSTRAPTGLF